MSFRKKIIIFSVSIAVFPLVFASILSLVAARNAVTQEVMAELDNLASIQKERIIEVLERNSSVAREEIIAIVSGFTGNSETAEMLVAERDENGNASFLHDRRFETAASALPNRVVSKERLDVPVTQALLGNEDIFTKAVDYRGVLVFATTRYIQEIDVGMVVKIDKREALQEVHALQRALLILIAVMLAVALLVALLVSRTFIAPLLKLIEGARLIGSGDLKHRLTVKSKDELGLLAGAFNSMAEKLHSLYAKLEEKVQERTAKLEEAKAKDEAVLTNIAEGLVVFDFEKGFSLFNNRAEKILGKGVVSEPPEQWPEFYGMYSAKEPKRPITIEEFSLSKVKRGETVVGEELFIQNEKIPKGVYIKINAGPIRLGDKITGAVFTIVDITEAQKVDQAKTEFVSLASHQLRTPLSAINWYTEMLLNGDAGEINQDQKKYLEEVYFGSKRMVDLVNALLNVSRLEIGTFSVELEPTNVLQLVRSVLDELKPQADEKKLHVQETHSEDLPIIQADPKLLRIVVQNLLSNAVKYTREGGEVSIDLKVVKKGEPINKHTADVDSLAISVSDTGMGIPKTQQGKIFTKLFRADNVKASDAEGTGLGLYIIKSIIDHSGGRVWFESEENKGTIFYAALPLEGMKAKEGTKKLS